MEFARNRCTTVQLMTPELILAACFITDFGTVLALGVLFANFNAWLLLPIPFGRLQRLRRYSPLCSSSHRSSWQTLPVASATLVSAAP